MVKKEVNRMDNGHKNVALVLLGIVAVTAIVGLVLMFVQSTETGQIYGGAIKGVQYPYWEGNSGASSPWGDDTYLGHGDPAKVDGALTGCPGGFEVSGDKVYMYQSRGYKVFDVADPDGVHVLHCVYPTEQMVNNNFG